MGNEIYIDMDDTLLDYKGAHAKALLNDPTQPYPQSVIGFYLSLEPLEGALKAYATLTSLGYEVYFLTAPSVMNPHCYTEKRLSIEKHFGFDACKNLIICNDKSLLRGVYLIDDRINSHKQNQFQGTLIQYGSPMFSTWDSIVDTFIQLHKRNVKSGT